MDAFSQELNNLLTDAFWSILRIEEQAANNVANGDLSISEMHMLEAVSKDENGRMRFVTPADVVDNGACVG